jgi:ectoine hydroxylase-related dioxygenase (phytanoyl-CoA dioxygenase family)
MGYADDFWREGYTVARGVFAGDVDRLAAECDRLRAEGARHPRTFRHGNQLWLVAEDPIVGRMLRFVKWPARASELLAAYRIDPRLLELIEPLLGRDLKQVVNQVIWKPPGSRQSSYEYHQDGRFRRPAAAYRELATSFVQSIIAIDAHRPESGCVRLLPGSHRRGDLRLNIDQSVLEGGCNDASLERAGLSPAEVIDLHLAPGDVAIWAAYLVHGSHSNCSAADRRSYANGYVRAANCDVGEWALRDGVPWPLSEAVLVEYPDLYARPEPHYVEGPANPYRGE